MNNGISYFHVLIRTSNKKKDYDILATRYTLEGALRETEDLACDWKIIEYSKKVMGYDIKSVITNKDLMQKHLGKDLKYV